MNHTRQFVLISALSLAATTTSNAAATRISYIDSFATARGNAFTATADNASAVFYNGAGLTQLEGTQIQGNLFAISLDYSADTALGNDDMDDDFQTVPSLFTSHQFKNTNFAAGFGIYSPFALGSDWSKYAAFTADPRVPYQTDLVYTKYHAVLAWQITETLSLAAGASYDTSDIRIQTAALKFDANDDTIGFSLSALWKPSEQHAFGINYQAKTDVTYDGNTSISGAGTFKTEADLTFPESIVVGYSYRPNENWNIEFNLDWTNWDRVNDLTIEGLPPIPGLDPSYDLNWDSAFIWQLGATRYFENGWNVSAGYTYVENAIPDQGFLPNVPDADRHFFALGLGRDYGYLYWHVTYQYTYADERTVSGSDKPIVDGDYSLDSQAIAFSIGYRF